MNRCKSKNAAKYSRMDQVKFVLESLLKILLAAFMNAMSQIIFQRPED